MNRKQRRKTSLFKETSQKLVIAGLQVVTNDKIPDGIMAVSPKEGERLAQMVAEATANQKPKEPTEEGN